MSITAPANPDPGRQPLRATLDALRYPLGAGALATNVTLLLSHGVASFVPVISLLLHLVCWLALYKYALEVLATSAEGQAQSPDGWSAVDPGVQWDHHWLQMLVLLLLLAATRVASEDWQLPLLTLLALLLPGMVLALAIGQNLWMAINPFAWASIGAQLGLAYLWLAVVSWPVLWLQARGGALMEASGLGLLAIPLFYFIAQHLTLSLFRLMGLAVHSHAEVFGITPRDRSKPVLARDKQQAHDTAATNAALQAGDPAQRAAQLAPQLAVGAAEPLHREYRRCLRELGDRAALGEHARRHVCQLLNLDQPRVAVSLANEALADDPGFCPPDALHTDALATAAERMTLTRQAAQLLANYRGAYPKRYDGLPLAMRAAQLFADQLNQGDVALRLLRAAQPMAEPGAQSTAFTVAIERLQRGESLLAPAPPKATP